MTSRTTQRGWDGAGLPAWMLAVGMITGAAVPAAVALALFASVALHRPFLSRALPAGSTASPAGLTIAWALGFVAIAAVQATGAVVGMGSITSPGGLVARTGFGLAVEAALLAATAAYLRAPSRRLR